MSGGQGLKQMFEEFIFKKKATELIMNAEELMWCVPWVLGCGCGHHVFLHLGAFIIITEL